MKPEECPPAENVHAICPSGLARWFTVAMFATAFAWVEAAVVFYLRTMVNRMDPYQSDPLPVVGGIGGAELVREAATLLMLFSVGMLAGKSWRSRWGSPAGSRSASAGSRAAGNRRRSDDRSFTTASLQRG